MSKLSNYFVKPQSRGEKYDEESLKEHNIKQKISTIRFYIILSLFSLVAGIILLAFFLQNYTYVFSPQRQEEISLSQELKETKKAATIEQEQTLSQLNADRRQELNKQIKANARARNKSKAPVDYSLKTPLTLKDIPPTPLTLKAQELQSELSALNPSANRRNVSDLQKEVARRVERVQVIEAKRGEILDANGNVLALSTPFYNFIISSQNYFEKLLRNVDFSLSPVVNQFKFKYGLTNKDLNPLFFGRLEVVARQGHYETQALDLEKVERGQIDLSSLSPVRKELFALVENFANKDIGLEALANAIDTPLPELVKTILSRPSSQYYVLGKRVSPTVAQYLNSLHIAGLTSNVEYKRIYPYGEVTAPLLGLVKVEDKIEDGKEIIHYSGQSGIERLANDALAGKEGYYRYEIDFNQNIINYLHKEDPQAGADIKLTVDINLQSLAYKALLDAIKEKKALKGSAVLLDIETGSVVAMVSAPAINPNDRSSITSKTISYLNNNAITDIYFPASTVKPFVVYSALENGAIGPLTIVETRTTPVPNSKFKITDHGNRPKKSIAEILKYSSNIGAYRITVVNPIRYLQDVYRAIGFNEYTGLGLSGESSGSGPAPDYDFTPIEVANYSYGYFQQVTALQLARAYSVLGGEGIRRDLRIISDDPVDPGRQVLNPKYTKIVVDMMKGVAQDSDGTAWRARIPNYNISVKTGTGEVHYGKEKETHNITYLAGVAPSSKPKFALVVAIFDPQNEEGRRVGGVVAAPVWKEIMSYALSYFNVPEDKMNKNRLVLGETKNQRPSK